MRGRLALAPAALVVEDELTCGRERGEGGPEQRVIEEQAAVDAEERCRAAHLRRGEDGELERAHAHALLREPRQFPLRAAERDQRLPRIGRHRAERNGSFGRHVGVHFGSGRLARRVERRREQTGADWPRLTFATRLGR